VQSQIQADPDEAFIAPDPILSEIEPIGGVNMQSPEIEDVWWGKHFQSEQILAAAGTLGEYTNGSMTSICVAVSTDNGTQWHQYTIRFEKPVSTYFQLEFTSEQDGWIAVCQSDGGQYLLYKTFDGGQTWKHFTSLRFNYKMTMFTFASSMVGWCTGGNSETQNNPSIQQTVDGGLTWQSANLEIPSEMFDGMAADGTGFRLGEISWNDRWELLFKPFRSIGYFSSYYSPPYVFFWSNEEQTWLWDAPDWKLPSSVSLVTFVDYIEGYLYPPINYDPKTGLSKLDYIRYLYYVPHHFVHSQKGLGNGDIISYDDIDRVTKCMFGDDNFNSRDIDYQWGNEIEATPEGYVIRGFWQIGDGEPKTKILDARDCGDGTIEVILERTSEDETTYEKSTIYQRCIFRPTELDGVPYFTLLSAMQIETPVTN
jgi:photosystem II stability/assembly factor-like uncharacterized protein